MRIFSILLIHMMILATHFAKSQNCEFDLSSHIAISPLATGLYRLVLDDEFKSSTLNPNYWIITDNETNITCTGTSKASNVSIIKNSNQEYDYLQLNVKDEVYNDKSPTWSTIRSNFYIYPNSYTEILCKTPSTQDNWPTFWYWDCDPYYDEIDVLDGVLQKKNVPCKIHGGTSQSGAKHCDGNHISDECDIRILQNGDSYNLSNGQRCKYGLVWDSFSLKIYLNDYLVRTINSLAHTNSLVLFLGQQTRSVYNDIDFNQTYLIDYVRVYTKKNEAVHFNQFPENGDLCKTKSAIFSVDAFPTVTSYSWSCTQLNFDNANSGWTSATLKDTVSSDHSYPITLTATFNVNGDVFSETDSSNFYVVDNPPPMPSTIYKEPIGISCYNKVYINAIPHVDFYSWKAGSGDFDDEGTYFENYDHSGFPPNSDQTLSVMSHNVCDFYSEVKTQLISFGPPSPNCQSFLLVKNSQELTGPFESFFIYDLIGKPIVELHNSTATSVFDMVNSNFLSPGFYILKAKDFYDRFYTTKILIP